MTNFTPEYNFYETLSEELGFQVGAAPQPNTPAVPTSGSNVVPAPNGSVLAGGSVYSPNFSKGNSGWRILSNGDVEFNDGTFRGNLDGGSIDIGGSDASSFHVDTSGNMYSGGGTYATAKFVVDGDGGVHLIDDAETWRLIDGQTYDGSTRVTRNQIIFADNTAESGSNAGSNFMISTHADNGTLIGIGLFIERKTRNVVIGGSTLPHASSALEIQSTTKGVRFPNMTEAQRDAITPGAGTVVYNTDSNQLNIYNGAWGSATGIDEVVDDTTPQLGGDLDANGKNITGVHELRIDATPGSDNSVNGPSTNSINAGVSLGVGQLVYLASDGEWALTDADAESTTKGLLAFCLENGTDGNPVKVALPGSFIRFDTWNFTVGATVYVSTVAGGVWHAAPTGSGDAVRKIGYAVTADIIYFLPSNEYTIVP